MRIMVSLFVAAAALSLGACNEATGGASFGPTSVSSSSAGSFRLPADAPCAGEINRYQTIVTSDRDTGNLEQKIYDQIETELSRAASACSAGNGGQAHALVAATKARHGYRS